MHANNLPSYASLTHVKDMPKGCAWGIWDKDGKRDQWGTLNLLTPEVVRDARNEIQKGISVSLNWPLQQPSPAAFGREHVHHRIKQIEMPVDGENFYTHDDILHINTQSSSQWDGFKHYPHQNTRLFYHGQKWEDVPESTDNGIHHWHERGCIVGRGVLVDYARYAEKHGIKIDVPTEQRIPASELKKAAAEQKLTFKPGDILIVRTGFTRWYDSLTKDQQDEYIGKTYRFVGVSADEEETIPWLWDSHFAAVAGDTIAFETCPPQKIHEHCLSFWGMPIGELWDLERLSKVCAEEGRWSFFLTSAPLNVIGGVASPPNVLAIL